MSGTLGGIYNTVSFTLQVHSNELAKLQEQASSGSRINRTSDGPTVANQVLELNSQGRSLENYMNNLLTIQGSLEMANTVLQKVSSSNISSVETTLTAVLSGTYTDMNRRIAAGQINEILEQIASLANTQISGGQYLFGGEASSVAPYAVERSGGQITAVIYQGSDRERQVEVATGVSESGVLVGDDIFRSNEREEPIFPQSGTGAAAGTGTSTVRGIVWLEVRDNGGTYEMSIDGWASYVTVNGTNNQAVTDSLTGRVLYVDTTNINSAGTDIVCLPGTFDIFETLITLRDALQGGDASKLSGLQQEVGNIMNELKQLLTQGSVSVGARTEALSRLEDVLKNFKFDAESETSRLQDADIAQVAVDIARQELLYQMSLQTVAKLFSLSLMNFIE